MDTLPLEILTRIFVRLHYLDWFECINVSRSWRSLTPKAVAHFWHHLKIDRQTLAHLGKIQYFPSLWSFTYEGSKAIRIVTPGQIKKLEIKTDSQELLGLPQQHTAHLRSLFVTYTGDGVFDLASFLGVCSNLVAFRFKQKRQHSSSHGLILGPRKLDDIPKQLNNLIYLELSCAISTAETRNILLCCPCLEAAKIIQPYFYTDLPVGEILVMCPNLSHLAIGMLACHTSFHWTFFENSVYYSYNGNYGDGRDGIRSGGLRWLLIDNMSITYDPVFPHLLEALEGVHLPIISFIESHHPLGSTSLRYFSCDVINDPHKLARVFEKSPYLEHIALSRITAGNHGEDGATMLTSLQLIEASQRLRRLHSLSLPFELRTAHLTAQFIELFIHTLSTLSLSVSGTIPQQEERHGIFNVLRRLQTLEYLWISVSKESATSVSVIEHLPPSLKRVHLRGMVDNWPSHHQQQTISLNKLETLRMTECTLQAAEEIVEWIRVAPTLRKIVLVQCLMQLPDEVRDAVDEIEETEMENSQVQEQEPGEIDPTFIRHDNCPDTLVKLCEKFGILLRVV